MITVPNYGWHVMLRNKTVWQSMDSKVNAASARTKVLINWIFGCVDPHHAGCPAIDGTMMTPAPKPKAVKGPKGGKSRRGS